jgi:hypothetical protein
VLDGDIDDDWNAASAEEKYNIHVWTSFDFHISLHTLLILSDEKTG